MLIQRGTVPDSLEHRLTWCPFVPHEDKEEHDTTVMIAISHGCQVWRDGGGRGRREGRREEGGEEGEEEGGKKGYGFLFCQYTKMRSSSPSLHVSLRWRSLI